MCEDVRLVNEIQMHDVFDMYKEQMHCEIVVGIFDRKIADVDEFADLEPIEQIPPDTLEQLSPDPLEQIPPEPIHHEQDIPADANPNAGAEYPPEHELDPDREPDMFDNAEEYVGIDDEGMYMPVPPPQPSNNAGASSNNGGVVIGAASNNVDGVAAFNNADAAGAVEGGFPLEAEINDTDPQEVHVIHVPENRKIVIGSQFPDIVTFRKAIRHWVVKKGFEFAGIKTNKTRFIARCAAEGCPRRIHASRIWDGKTIEVILLSVVSFHLPLYHAHKFCPLIL